MPPVDATPRKRILRRILIGLAVLVVLAVILTTAACALIGANLRVVIFRSARRRNA